MKRDPNGRGGSAEVHDALRAGDILELGTPRNLFSLERSALELPSGEGQDTHPENAPSALVAGGIGVAPLLVMAHVLHREGLPLTLHVCAPDREQLPFDAQLDALLFAAAVQRSGRRFDVAADETIVDALRLGGVHVPTACLQGVCGACKTPLIDGEVAHRDAVLSDAERRGHLCLCVSRARGERIVIDR